MVEDIKQIENFVRGYPIYLYVQDRGDHAIIEGTFDDLDPEPEREELDKVLSKIRMDIRFKDDLSVEFDDVSEVKSRYGRKFIRVYPE
jgi:hypothetical protein